MNVYISGGCKNGKSDFAQAAAIKLANGGKRYYVATMVPQDAEDRARIRLHQTSRAGMGFETLEAGQNLLSCLNEADSNAVFLLDSVTALLQNEMFPKNSQVPAGPGAPQRCLDSLLAFAGTVRDAVFVSDFIYSDAFLYDACTEAYRRALAMLDRALAETCDTVIELCAGIPIVYKGRALQ